jgi:hypothetical protein
LLPASISEYHPAVATSITRDEKKRWLRVKAVGVVTRDELIDFLRTARSSQELRMWPMMFDADQATTDMTDGDVARAVAVVQNEIKANGTRAHVAVATAADRLYRWMLLYEAKCAEIGVRLVRVFRQGDDAERWLDIVSAARNLQ